MPEASGIAISVPEPSAKLLALLGAPMLICRRLRKVASKGVVVFIGMIEVDCLTVINSCRPSRQLLQLMPSLDR